MATITPIAHIKSDFPTKFGIPRQSGLVQGSKAYIVFEEQYRSPEALRGLEDFSHIWLIWGFSAAEYQAWSPTVRPPRLGGNTRMGVFATRSPFRPNSLGISSVKIDEIELHTPKGPLIHVLGADLMDGTPIYDIKPYLPFTDCHPEATGGFADQYAYTPLEVQIAEPLLSLLPEGEGEVLRQVLAQDPRPHYQNDPNRVYGMEFGDYEVKFSVDGEVLTVRDIQKRIIKTSEET